MVRALSLACCAVVLGCGSDGDPPLGSRLLGDRSITDLRVTLPDGWTKRLDGGVWKIDPPGSRAGPPALGIAIAEAHLPRTADPYLHDLLAHQVEDGTALEVVSQEAVPGGFALTFRRSVVGSKRKPTVEYHAIRELGGGVVVRCLSLSARDERRRAQLDAICKSAAL